MKIITKKSMGFKWLMSFLMMLEEFSGLYPVQFNVLTSNPALEHPPGYTDIIKDKYG